MQSALAAMVCGGIGAAATLWAAYTAASSPANDAIQVVRMFLAASRLLPGEKTAAAELHRWLYYLGSILY